MIRGTTRRFAAAFVAVALLGPAGVGATGAAATVTAAATMARIPGTRSPLVLGPAPAHPTLVAATPPPTPAPSSAFRAFSTTSTFTVNYDAGFNANPAAKTAFQFAVDQWSNVISSPVPIVVNASFSALPPGVLGSAGPNSAFRDFPGTPHAGTWYPVALANALHGSDLDPANADIDAQFSSVYSGFYFGTDGNTAGKLDFASVVLHELGHGLGFLGALDVNAGVGALCCGLDGPLTYDRFTTSNGTSLLSFTNNSAALGTALQGQDVRFTGPIATAANGGTTPRLYAPNPWQGGSSYSHLDEATYPAGNANSLMTPAIGPNEVIHAPGAITLGIFADSGWTVSTLPRVSVGRASVVEGRSGNRLARFNVALSAPVAWPVTVHLTTTPGTATAPSDYTTRSSIVTLPAGTTATSVTVAVAGDTVVEPNETFGVKLSAPAGAILGRSSVLGTILNDDTSSGLRIAVGDAAIQEGDSGARTVRIPVTLSAVSASAVTVNWATGSGTATAGVDYTARSGTVTIPAGSLSGMISVVVAADTATEANENIPVALSGASGATIARATGYATINNDD